ncbi:hypothetical protein F5Y16DRAFT_417831 [Xylariaceae sp. FL0255]|nr:hypothetical protein F5Y16DRAFT_417831 [Xylariaceae sp. FL0255]
MSPGSSYRIEPRDPTCRHTTFAGAPTPQKLESIMISPEPSGRSRSRDRRNEPLGLHVIHDPAGQRSIDIIFVHGLGGTSRLSWSWNRDLSFFWPQEWLPLEPGFETARLLTFGYNAFFMSQSKDTFNIADFAKDLLLQMRFGNDENVQSLDIGKVPIIFVVHSMGGLVIKKAYILGSQDPQFKHVLDAVCSMVFLATPHRGSNLAEILNRFLSVSFQSPKQYINDLQRNSARIIDINDQFKLYADKIQLVSFFETQATSVGIKKMVIVERDSAILDYPSELSSPLNADHHGVTKYQSRHDVNYMNVRNVIKSLVDRFSLHAPTRRHQSSDQQSVKSSPDAEEIMSRLGAMGRPREVLDNLLEQYVRGSCDWILTDKTFTSFVEDERPQTSILHITGQPGTGKSVLASFLIQHLEDMSVPIQYWYFKHDDQSQRSNRQSLLSLACQCFESLPAYADRLLAMVKDIASIARSDIRSLWQKLFISPLDKTTARDPMFWVIDALDESESAQAFLGLLASLKNVKFPLRVIFLTRSHTVTRHFEKLKAAIPANRIFQINLATPKNSLQLYIEEKLDEVPWPSELKESITASLLHKSQGNFLWLSLVLRELISCDTSEQLEGVMEETPWELVDTYRRIEQSVADDLRPADEPLLQAILSWVTCSERQLSEEELKEALRPQFSVLNMRHTITRLCGDFIVIDKKGNISTVHYTAKEYLLKSASTALAVNRNSAHALIFSKCIATLTDPRFRIQLRARGCAGLLRYCCLSWSHHLIQSELLDNHNDYMRKLEIFFRSSACLAWIESIAAMNHLQVLISTAKALTTFVERTHRINEGGNPLANPILAMESLTMWSTELVRVVGKFGSHLLDFPSCIHTLVPIFCPPESALGRTFSPTGPMAPRVTGISNTAWDDSLAKFSYGKGHRLKSVHCLDSSFGIVTSEKCVNLYSSLTFQELRSFRHDETIVVAHFSQDGDLLATCGIRSIKIWEVSTSRLVHTYSNPNGMRAMAASFSRDSSEVIVLCVDSNLRRQLISEEESWVKVEWQQQNEINLGRGGGTPICAAFSPDGSKVAVSHRTAPIMVWDTETGNLVGRSEGRGGRTLSRNTNVDYPSRLAWNPITDHVVGIFLDGSIFKWYPLDSQHEQEDSVTAFEVACSPDGRLLVTAQRDGSLKIFNFENFSLLYSLSCMTRASALAISPDGRRIYDIRQSFCNVWEPNALIRMAEMDEHQSDTASTLYDGSVTFSLASEASAVLLDPVTALHCDRRSNAYAYGNSAGVIQYYPHAERDSIQLSSSLLSITCLGLSANQELIAASSIDRRVAIWKRSRDDIAEPSPNFEMKFDAPIQDLIFGAHDTILAVVTDKHCDMFDLDSNFSNSRLERQSFDYWLSHPTQEGCFFAIEPTGISCYVLPHTTPTRQWKITLHEISISGTAVSDGVTLQNLLDETNSSVYKIFVAPSGSDCLMSLTKKLPDGHEFSQWLLLPSLFLQANPDPKFEIEPEEIFARHLPSTIQSLMQTPLGFVTEQAAMQRRDVSSAQDQTYLLVFIDCDFWVRTWPMDDAEGLNSKRHFFLPRDWINVESLALASVTLDGRFIYPRNGEVAVVHNCIIGMGEMNGISR